MEDRAEKVLPATRAWRKAAREALEALPRGIYGECALAVGCSKGMLSQLIAGEVDSSPFVGPISDFLKIPYPYPHQEAVEDDVVEASSRFKAADASSRKLVLDLLRKLSPNPSDD